MKTTFLSILLFIFSVSVSIAQSCTSCGASGWPVSLQAGSSGTFTVPALSGATYVWVVSGSLQIISGQGTNTAVIKGTGAGSGTVYVTRYKDGAGACTNYMNITIISGNAPPAAPGGVKIIIEPCETVGIYVGTVPGATGYNYYIDGALYSSEPSQAIFVDLVVPEVNVGYHTVCISAYNAYGTSAKTCANFYVSCIGGNSLNRSGQTGNEQKSSEEKNKFLAFPNPVNGELNIPDFSGELEVYAIDGTKVCTYNIRKAGSIDVSALKPGTYILKAVSEGEVKRQTIVVE